jgi:hypothetical protein
MKLRLRPGTADDIEVICRTVFSAFASNPIVGRVFPETSAQAQAFWHKAMTEEIQDPDAWFLVIEDVDASPAPAFVAFAKWNRVSAGFSPPPNPSPDEWPSDGDPDLANEFYPELDRKHEEIMARRQHWYLEIVATRKEFWGKGAAGMLVGWGVEMADKDGWECYLDSTPDGKKLYEKFGFQEVVTLKWLGDAYAHCFMRREKRTENADAASVET